MRDIAVLREIQRLSQEEGINLAGVKHILDLQRDNEMLTAEVARLHSLVDALSNELESTRAVAARLAQLRNTDRGQGGTDLVPIRQTGVMLWQTRRDDSDDRG
jgi:MerR family transcriptional regulator/heat shock protein HspR